MIKLIAIDTDGTLLNSRGQIQAIAKACFCRHQRGHGQRQ